MNLGIRAILYSARKWKKTLLVFCLLLAITTLVLSGLAIADAQEEQAEEVRGTTGASFTVERNLSTGGWANDSDGTYSTQELITKDMIQKSLRWKVSLGTMRQMAVCLPCTMKKEIILALAQTDSPIMLMAHIILNLTVYLYLDDLSLLKVLILQRM